MFFSFAQCRKNFADNTKAENHPASLVYGFRKFVLMSQVLLPNAVLDRYKAKRGERRTILFEWASMMTQKNLRKTFKCGKWQAQRAYKDYRNGGLPVQRKVRKECVWVILLNFFIIRCQRNFKQDSRHYI